MPGPGPITKVIIQTLWKRLFDAASDNALYLPRIIRDGYPKWNLPSYDPARPGGTSQPFAIPGVPTEVSDSACMRPEFPIPPVATSAPQLQLQNVLFEHLGVMTPNALTFSDTDPIFTAVVNVGSSEKPFTLTVNVDGTPNFLFHIACCEPVAPNKRDCGEHRWTADASGGFLAKAHDALVSATIRLVTEGTGPLSVKIEGIGVSVPDLHNITVDFFVAGQPQWVQDLAQIAVNEGVGSGALVTGLQTFLNSADVIGNIETLVNNALKNILEALPHE